MQYVIYIAVVLFFTAFLFGSAWYFRARYAKQMEGHLVAEMWPPRGIRYKVRLPIETNGYEVKAPSGHRCPSYFFNKESIYYTKWPEMPLLPLRFMQIDAPTVSWALDNPEPINPHMLPGHEIVTSEMIDIYKDKSFILLMMAASEEIKALHEQYTTLLDNVVDKRLVYAGILAAVVLALAATIISVINLQGIGELKALWGA